MTGGERPDLAADVVVGEGEVRLPFDLSQVVDNLRLERYPIRSRGVRRKLLESRIMRDVYYFLRPRLSVGVRRPLQKARLKGWEENAFPRWPVDVNVDTLMRKAMALALRGAGLERIPFIWFWPNGVSSCGIVTHDVESADGRNFCDSLMDLDDAFHIRSSFQIIPEGRYEHAERLVDEVRGRGFEVNVHDFNHDGYLFQDKREFARRAQLINEYAQRFRSRGFRAGAMYRKQEWFQALEFSYDMSVPNVAHLEPQGGGGCTVMPYFIGSLLELPLTTLQDYSLFQILGKYSIDLWKQQVTIIRENNGFVSLLTHPDYLIDPRARDVYRELLVHISELRAAGVIWLASPGDVDRWWRTRHEMRLFHDGVTWRIDGPDKDRARVAYAVLDGDDVVFEVEDVRDTGASMTRFAK